MEQDLISVIIPVYKVEPHLDECVSSVVNQTYQNLEIILVDDGSPDNCPRMCDEWAKRDARVKVIHKENGGSSSARNAGLDAAAGEYIGFVDSDDMVRPDMYELLWEALHNTHIKIASCQDGWNPNMPYQLHKPAMRTVGVEETINGIFRGFVGTSVWRRLYHRSIWKELRFPEGETNEDYPLLIPTTVAAGGMVQVRERLYYYRPTPGSITGTYWKKDSSIVLKNMERIRRQLEENQLDCMDSFSVFMIRSVFSLAAVLDKNLPRLSEEGRKSHRECIRILQKNIPVAMRKGVFRTKHKVLYMMVISRTMRPIYKLLGKS